MKKYFIILVVFFVLISCKDKTPKSELIVGLWQLEKVSTNQHIENQEQYKKSMIQLINTTQIQFNEDNTFGGAIWGDTSFGYWTIKKDSLIIEDISNKTKFGVIIKSLTENKLELEEKSDSLIEILTFKK
jgi:hypothetical protein